MEEKEREKKQKEDRKRRKEAKEKHWDMMKWVVGFIDANKDEWNRRRMEEIREREESRKMLEWRMLTRAEKVGKLRQKEAEARREVAGKEGLKQPGS